MTAPGPAALGRGVIIEAGAAIPAPWMAAPVLTIDAEVLRSPAEVVERLHRAWVGRHPVVVELAVDPVKFRVPQVIERPVWQLGPESEPWFDRLHFLVWNNNYQSGGGVARLFASAPDHCRHQQRRESAPRSLATPRSEMWCWPTATPCG